jgi:iron-sulfur cluster assembly accessory protein
MKDILTITDSASEFIHHMLAKQPGTFFRLSVKKTGCSGYSYAPALIQTIVPGDVKQLTSNGLTIYIDATWLSLLEGVQIDYTEDKQGVKQKKLVFTNPKETSRCGCGESFHLE